MRMAALQSLNSIPIEMWSMTASLSSKKLKLRPAVTVMSNTGISLNLSLVSSSLLSIRPSPVRSQSGLRSW